MKKMDAVSRKAKNKLLVLHGELGTWANVAERLSTPQNKINRGQLHQIVKGKRPASNHILQALDMPARLVLVPVCPHCGKVHLPSKRHVSSNPALLKFIREVSVPFLAAREHE